MYKRQYLVSGEQRDLTPYRKAAGSLAPSIQKIRSATHNPNQQRRMNEIDPLVSRVLQQMQEAIDLRDRKGFEAARQHVLGDNSNQITEAIQAKLSDYEEEERSLLGTRDVDARQAADTTKSVVLFGTMLGLGLSATVSFLVIRSLTRRLAAVTALAGQIASGDLSNRT